MSSINQDDLVKEERLLIEVTSLKHERIAIKAMLHELQKHVGAQGVVEYYSRRKADTEPVVPSKAWNDHDHPFWMSMEAAEVAKGIMDKLSDVCAEGFYFGARHDNHYALGFWKDERWEG